MKKEYNEDIERLIKEYDKLNKRYCELMDKNIELAEEVNELKQENQQLKENLVYEKNFWRENNKILKQSQNEKAIEELEKIKISILNIPGKFGEIKTLANGYSTYYVDRTTIICKIDDQIKELERSKR